MEGLDFSQPPVADGAHEQKAGDKPASLALDFSKPPVAAGAAEVDFSQPPVADEGPGVVRGTLNAFARGMWNLPETWGEFRAGGKAQEARELRDAADEQDAFAEKGFMPAENRAGAKAKRERAAALEAEAASAVGEAQTSRALADEFFPKTEADKAVEGARGVVPTLKAMAENPSALLHGAVEGAPQLAAAMGVGALTKNPVLAAAAGGVVMGSDAYAQARAGAIGEELARRGIDPGDTKAVTALMRDKAFLDEMDRRAAIAGTGGAVVGAVMPAAGAVGGMTEGAVATGGKEVVRVGTRELVREAEPGALRATAAKAAGMAADAGAQGAVGMAADAAEQLAQDGEVDGGRMVRRGVNDAAMGAAFRVTHAGAEVRAARERMAMRDAHEAGVITEFALRHGGRPAVWDPHGDSANAEGTRQNAKVGDEEAKLPTGMEVMGASPEEASTPKEGPHDSTVPEEVLARFAEEEDAAVRMRTEGEAQAFLMQKESERLAPLDKPFLSAEEWYGTLGRRQVERLVDPNTGDYASGAVRWDKVNDAQLERALDIPEISGRAEAELTRRGREAELEDVRRQNGDSLRDLLAQGQVKLPGGADAARGRGDLGGELEAVKDNLGNQGAWMRYTDKGWTPERTLEALHEHGFKQIQDHNDLLDALDAMARGKEVWPLERPAVLADAPAERAAKSARSLFNNDVKRPDFKRWFGDWEKDPQGSSKVVDEHGEPLVVYHGSPNYTEFWEFKGTGLHPGRPIFTSSSKEVARGYARRENGDMRRGVYSLFMNLRNPLEVTDLREFNHRDVDAAFNRAIAGGHDGVVFRNIVDTNSGEKPVASDVWAAFDPKALKSAELNNGRYDPRDSSILKDQADRVKNPVEGVEKPEQGGQAAVPRPAEGERLSGAVDATGGVRMAIPKEAVGFDLPALVELARALGPEGMAPLVRRMKNNGEFHAITRIIKLNRDLFKAGNEPELARVLAHELGHLVDYLPDSTLKRGNLGGRLLSAKNHLKQTFALDGVKYDGEKLRATLKELREGARMRTESLIGERPRAAKGDLLTPELKAAQKDWDRANRLYYAELADAELPKRGFARDAAVREELKAWSRAIKPFDEAAASEGYRAYRDSGVELYADAVSGIFVYPEAFADAAPLTWRAWWRNLEAKPEAQKAVFEAQRLLQGAPEERAAAHSARSADGFERAAQIYLEKAAQREHGPDMGELMRKLGGGLRDEYVDRKARARTAENSQLLNDAEHFDGKTWAWVGRLKTGTLDPLAQAGVKAADFAEYLMLRRIAQGDRSEGVANPNGYDGAYAAKLLVEQRKRWTPAQLDAVARAEAGVRARWREAMTAAVEAGLYSPAQVQAMRAKSGDAYVPFAAVEHFEGNVGAGFKAVTGNLGDIVDPVLASALKATNIIRAAELNKGKVAAMDGLLSHPEHGVTKAEAVHGKDGAVAFRKAPEGMATVELWRHGVKEGYNVPKGLEVVFERMTPGSANVMGEVLGLAFRNFWRNAWITYNPGFVFGSGPLRDMGRAFTNMPDWRGRVAVPAEIAANMASRVLGTPLTESARAVRDMLEGRPNPLADRLVELGGMPPPHELFATAKALDSDTSMAAEAQRAMLRGYKLIPDAMAYNGKIRTALKALGNNPVFRYLEKTGQTAEMVGKVAAFHHLTRKQGWSELDAARFVRDYVGVPDTKQGGKYIRVVQQLFPFANVAVQGLRKDMDLAIGGGRDFAGRGLAGMGSRAAVRMKWWGAFVAGVGGYQALTGAALAGLLGAEAKDLFGAIPENDIRTGLCIPLGWHTTPDGARKAIYIKVPLDPTHAFLGSLFREPLRVMGGEHSVVEGVRGVATATGNLMPGLDSGVKLTGAWKDYALGNNPIDDWRQQHILTEAQQAARPVDAWPANKQMLLYSLGQTGLYSYRKDNGEVETGADRAANLPVISRFLKVSNTGWREKLRGEDAVADVDGATLRANLPETIQALKSEAASLGRVRDTLAKRVASARTAGREPDPNDLHDLNRANRLRGWSANYRGLEKAAADAKRRGDMTRVKQLVGVMEKISKGYYPGAERAE